MTPRPDMVAGLCALGAGLETFADAWGAWLLTYEAMQEEAFNRGGLEGVRALTALAGLDLVTASLRNRMRELGLGPLLDLPNGMKPAPDSRVADLPYVGSETVQ